MKRPRSTEMNNWCKYHLPGGHNLNRIKQNVVFISIANSIEHELAKTKICYELKKQGHPFISEAVPNDRPNRRIDIVDLTTGEEIEVERTGEWKNVAKSFKVLSKSEYEALINK